MNKPQQTKPGSEGIIYAEVGADVKRRGMVLAALHGKSLTKYLADLIDEQAQDSGINELRAA